MPRLVNTLPKYRRHRASGRAIVTLDGQDVYLGPYGSSTSKREYDRLVGEWVAAGRRMPSRQVGDITLNELLVAFLRWARTYYVKDGKPTAEVDCLKSAVRPLRELYGRSSVADFGPLALKAVRERMIAFGWCRYYVNRSVSRLKRIFRWGVENELVPPVVYQGVKEVAGLKQGRTVAHERPPREPADADDVEAAKGAMRQKTRDLVDLILLTAARPSELLTLTGRMIKQGGPVWVATLPLHKTMHQGRVRKLYFGPQAQMILRRHAKFDPDRRLFKPTSLRDNIERACKRAKVKHWTPYQLRHLAATRIRAEFGLEAAQVILGHSRADVTQIYAKRDESLALVVAAKVSGSLGETGER